MDIGRGTGTLISFCQTCCCENINLTLQHNGCTGLSTHLLSTEQVTYSVIQPTLGWYPLSLSYSWETFETNFIYKQHQRQSPDVWWRYPRAAESWLLQLLTEELFWLSCLMAEFPCNRSDVWGKIYIFTSPLGFEAVPVSTLFCIATGRYDDSRCTSVAACHMYSEVPGSSLGQETGNSKGFFYGFPCLY